MCGLLKTPVQATTHLILNSLYKWQCSVHTIDICKNFNGDVHFIVTCIFASAEQVRAESEVLDEFTVP